jgi:hypothetical protein
MLRRILPECSSAGNFLVVHAHNLEIPRAHLVWRAGGFRVSTLDTSRGWQAITRAKMLDNRYSIEVRHGISICELLTWMSLVDDDERRESDAALPMRHLTEYCLPGSRVFVEVNE